MSHRHVAGHNENLGTTMAPIATGGVWRTPQVAAATPLRVKAGGDAADNPLGAGARQLELVGMDITGKIIREKLLTNGASASSPTTQSFLRLLEVIVHASGTYASVGAGSHVGVITIEDAAGTEDWAEIELHGGTFPAGRTEICAYTIPLGYKGLLLSFQLDNSAVKAIDAALFMRPNILQTEPPYSGMRNLETFAGVAAGTSIEFKSAGHNMAITLPPLSDIGFMAKVATAGGEVAARMLLQIVPENWG